MYLEHFGLSRQPFQITPDTDFFFPGAERQETLHGLIHSAQHNEGIVKVIGEIGSGKSLLCRMLANDLPDNFQVVFLANPNLGADAVVTAILGDLGVSPQPHSFNHPTQLLQSYLLEQNQQNRRVLLLVEEAQAMPPSTLEALRLLTNLETAETKLLRMILFGQPELDQTLNTHALRQFRDRITQNFYLRAVQLEESGAYLHHRLCVAGYRGEPLFHGELLAQLQQSSAGRLRPLNIIADKTLLAAYVDDARIPTQQHLQKALLEVELSDSEAVPRTTSTTNTSIAGELGDQETLSWREVGRFIGRRITNLATKCLLNARQLARYLVRSMAKSLKMWSSHPLTPRLTSAAKKRWRSVVRYYRHD